MKVRVLGCSGGICQNVATTSFLIDDDILIDAGTGVGDLTIEEMRCIKTIFITHSHLDHVASIPFLADTLFDSLIGNPLMVYAQPKTISALQKHIFNWTIWPDFTALPHSSNAVLKLRTMEPGSVMKIDERIVEMISVNHAIPGVGYRVEENGKSFAFSGDTTSNENFWAALNSYDSLDLLFIESAFANKEIDLARVAFHYSPSLLAQDLPKLKLAKKPKLCISHLKPGSEEQIMKECKELFSDWDLHELKSGDMFEL